MSSDTDRPRVGIACQGGGSHTAFTAGVLDRLLEEREIEFDIAGFSGTSGGAICAFVAWFGLASEGDPDGRAVARRLLARTWDELGSRGPFDEFLNAMAVGAARAQSAGLPLPSFSPYDTPAADWGRETLAATLTDVVDPAALSALRSQADADLPRLDIGAVDVQRGTFRTFTERDVTHDAVLASAAVPNLFRAAPVTMPDGSTRWYWDGLFSQNPPLGNLFERAADRADRPEELWVVQINPQREYEIPTDLSAIADRRNELGGNLSVNQELELVRTLNEWHARGYLSDVYEPVAVKTINLDERLLAPDRSFDYATKIDRSPAFLDRLWEHGRAQAARFLATERDRRRVRQSVLSSLEERRVAADEWLAPNYEAYVPTRPARLRRFLGGEPASEPKTVGREGAFELGAQLREAIPDLRFRIEETVAEPGAIATRWTGTGTQAGRLLDVEPTGEVLTLSGIRIDHLADGRLTDSWVLVEQWSLLRQLDAAATPAPVSTVRRVTATPVVTQLSAPAENEDLVRTLVSDVWSDGDRTALATVLDEDSRLYLDAATDLVGRDAYWAFVARYREAFPDLELGIEDAVSEGDKIACRLRLRGTHEGSFMNVAPTGERVDATRMAIYHVDDGRIVETGIVEDTLGLLQQLGAPVDALRP
jgi:NTE family protein